MNPLTTKVCVVGISQLGAVASACLAELGYSVVGVETNPQKAEKLNHGDAPRFEPGLSDLMRKNIGHGRLFYSSDLAGAVKDAPFVLLASEVPVKNDDAMVLHELYRAALDICPWLAGDATVIVVSPVPIGTCEHIAAAIHDFHSARKVRVACVPGNIRPGRAIESFLKPAVIVLGADDEATLDRLQQFFAVLPLPKLLVNLRTAEMIRHALHAFLATEVSFSAELADLCEAVGADAVQVAAALRHDERIGPHACIEPGGLGFADPMARRDVRLLRHFGQEFACKARLLDSVWQVNEERKSLVGRKLENIFGHTRGLTLAVLGFDPEAGGGVLCERSPLAVIGELAGHGAAIKAFDPRARLADIPQQPGVELCPDAYSAVEGADALIVLADYPDFLSLDFVRMRSLMRRPVLIDIQNILHYSELTALGFEYRGVGRSNLSRRVPLPAPRTLTRAAAAGVQEGSTENEQPS